MSRVSVVHVQMNRMFATDLFHIIGRTTAVSSLILGWDSARPSKLRCHSHSHMLDYVIAELRAFDLRRTFH